MKTVQIKIIDYPTASRSAVFGLLETIEIANQLCASFNLSRSLQCQALTLEQLKLDNEADVVILPPCSSDGFYAEPCIELDQYLKQAYDRGCLLASACVGAFILARGGFLDNKYCTTHWRLAESFQQQFPKVKLDVNAMLINEDRVITAGGRMAWLDLAFAVVSQFASPTISASLSKEIVMDSGYREQKFYSQFVANFDHKDELVSKIQDHLAEHYAQPILVSELANTYFVSTRTLQRRFHHAQGITLIDYLQKLRLQKACQMLELTKTSVNEISYAVGYQNVSAFRKVFVREYGLSPRDYRKRFATFS